MNQEQKSLMIGWITAFSLAVAIFAVIFIFDEPYIILTIIISVFALVTGKNYHDLSAIREQSFLEFTEYAHKRKGIFIVLASFYAVLPLFVYFLISKGYMKITTDPKDLIGLACLFIIPFFIFDMGHRIYVYRKYQSDK